MKRICLLILLLAAAWVGTVQAENIPNVVVVYIDEQNNVQFFRQSTGEKIQLYSSEEGNVSRVYLCPSGQHVALHTTYGLAMYTLNPVRRLFTRQLIAYPYVPVDPDINPMEAENQWFATGIWSPDGSHFAWTEGTPGTGEGNDYHNGDGTVGIFSAIDGRVVILPDEEGISDNLMWSPDSAYLVYNTVLNYGTGAGANYSGTYVVSADGKSHVLPNARGIAPLGWLSNSHLIYSHPASVEGLRGIFDYDPHTDITTQIVSADQYAIDLATVDPSDDKIIFSVGDLYPSDVNAPGILQAGLYIIDTPQSTPRLLHKAETFNAADMLTSGFILGTQGVLRLSDDKLVLPYDNNYFSDRWASGAPYGIVEQDGFAALLNLDSGQARVLGTFSAGMTEWFAPRAYFAVTYNNPGSSLYVGTVDGGITHLFDDIHYQYRMTPHIVYESNKITFPALAATCPGMLKSRLAVGQGGHVIPNTSSNNLRAKPDKTSDLLAKIPAGDSFTVIDGPVCNDGTVWWKVNYPPLNGWTAESQGDTYFLEPLS
jgi:hypothetical protein